MQTSPEIPKAYLEFYQDPRGDQNFQPELYPEEVSPVPASNLEQEALKAKFQAAYYRRNLCLARLSGRNDETPEDRSLLRQSLEATRAIDALEEACAPWGFLAEPEMEDGLMARRLKFVHAPPASYSAGETVESSFSLYVEIPPLPNSGETEPGDDDP